MFKPILVKLFSYSSIFMLVTFSSLFQVQRKTTSHISIDDSRLMATPEVGSLPGAFYVDGNGAANYQIPIEVPNGLGTVKPDLSFKYNSQSKNGFLGVGWSISGLSGIRRIGRKIPYDLLMGGVQFDAEDRFAIDGMELIAYKDKSGNILTSYRARQAVYGKDGTEYKTTIDKGAVIKSYGDCTTGNCYFEVLSIDGSKSKYLAPENYNNIYNQPYTDIGINPINASQQSLEWKIVAIKDKNQRLVTVAYEPTSRGILPYLPKYISYGQMDEAVRLNNNTLPPSNKWVVTFEWEERKDSTFHYTSGVRTQMKSRLKEVNISAQLPGQKQALISSYQLDYKYSVLNSQSLLSSIVVCDKDGNCLPPSTFEYENDRAWEGKFKNAGVAWKTAIKSNTNVQTQYFPGDYDGDGKTDLLAYQLQQDLEKTSDHKVDYDLFLLNNYTETADNLPFSYTPLSDIEVCAKANIIPADFDMDGKTDFLLRGCEKYASTSENAPNKNLFLGRSSLSQPFKQHDWSISPPNNDILKPSELMNAEDYEWIFGEFNGDGKMDILVKWYYDPFKPRLSSILYNEGNGSYYVANAPDQINDYRHIKDKGYIQLFPGDFQGNGRSDFIGRFYEPIPTSSWRKNTSQPAILELSNSKGGFKKITLPTSEYTLASTSAFNEEKLFVGHFNHDHNQDFVYIEVPYIQACQNCGTNVGKKAIINTYISKGNGDFEKVTYEWTYKPRFFSENNSHLSFFSGDFNGDGLTDLVLQNKNTELHTSYNERDEALLFFINKGNGQYEIVKPVVSKPGSLFDPDKKAPGIIQGDFNGDGRTDLMAVTSSDSTQLGNTFLSSDTGNTLLTRITNGVKKITSIDYASLKKEGLYTPNTAPLTYPYVPFNSSMWVVEEHSIKDHIKKPTNEWRYGHKYEDAQINLERGWLGFRKTTLIDYQKGVHTTTVHSNRFPYLGNIEERIITSYTVSKSDHPIIGHYKSGFQAHAVDPLNTIYRINNTSHELQHYDKSGAYDYKLIKKFYYDEDHLRITKIANLGDEIDAHDDVYTHFRYFPYSEDDPSKQFLLKDKRVSNKAAVDWNATQWIPQSDLSWTTYDYDDRHNMTSMGEYLYQCPSGEESPDCDNGFVNTSITYNIYGNPSIVSYPSGLKEKISYAEKEHFPAYTSTIEYLDEDFMPIYDKPIKMTWDPRFNLLVSLDHIDPSQNYKIGSYDGIGRIYEIEEQHPNLDQTVTTSHTLLENIRGQGLAITHYQRKDWNDNDTTNWLKSTQHLDAFGRTILTTTEGYDQQTLRLDSVSYGINGQIDRKYYPIYHNKIKGFHLNQTDQKSNTDIPSYMHYHHDSHGRINEIEITIEDSTSTLQYIAYDYIKNREIWVSAQSPNASFKETNNTPHTQSIWYLHRKDSRGKTIYKAGPYKSIFIPGIDDHSIYKYKSFGETHYKYDLLGRIVNIIDPLGQTSTIEYNSLGDVIKEFKPETGTQRHTYNENGLLHSSTDANGNTQTFEYDLFNRITKKTSTDPTGKEQSTSFYYDELDDTSIPADNIIGKLAKVEASDSSFTYQYSYDKRGNYRSTLTQITSLNKALSQKTNFLFRYHYNALDQMTQVTYPDKTVVQNVYDHPYAMLSSIRVAKAVKGRKQYSFNTMAQYDNYTAFGNASQITYGNSDLTIDSYDYLGRLEQSRTSKGAHILNNVRYSWSVKNKLKSITDLRELSDEQAVESQSENHYYDISGRLERFTGEHLNTELTYAYDAAGNIQHMANKNSILTSTYTFSHMTGAKHQYENLSLSRRPTGIPQSTFNTMLLNYDYDANGNQTQLESFHYQYNSNNQLSAVKQYSSPSDSSNHIIGVNFTYDCFGRRINKHSYKRGKLAEGEPRAELPVEEKSWYISDYYSLHWTQNDGLFQKRYIPSPDGVLSVKVQAFDASQLLSISDNIGTSIYKSSVGLAPALIYQWCLRILAWILLLLIVLWFIFECVRGLRKLPSRFIPSIHKPSRLLQKTLVIRFGYILMVGSFLMVSVLPANAQSAPPKQKDGEYYFHHDHLGSTSFVSNENGGVEQRYLYSPYGTPSSLVDEGIDVAPKFTGKEFDSYIALNYMGSRYLDSQFANRFISPDPAGQYHSPYVYGYDDPLSGVDPDGEFFVTLAVILSAAIIGAYVGGSIANHSFNPAHWNWSSSATWVGIATGGLAGAAIGAAGVAGAVGLGLVSAGSTVIAGFSAGTVASFSMDLAFLVYDGYTFATDPNLENGVFLALDLIPFLGPLIGKVASKGFEMARGMLRSERGLMDAEHLSMEAIDHPAEFEHSSCPMSFAEGTEIQTKAGVKAIQDIDVGDEVLSYDEQSEQTAYYPVSNLYQRTVSEIFEIVLPNDIIHVTGEHPFYLFKQEVWINADELKAGDQLYNTKGDPVPVLSVNRLQKNLRVYNFTVDHAHNYYVSIEGVLVHNILANCLKAKGKRRPGWRKSSTDQLFEKQAANKKGYVKSSVSNKTHLKTEKVWIGKNNPRKRTIWDIDHITPYRFLLEAAEEAKSTVTWKQMITISNEPKNLRLMTMSENVSHAFEPSKAQGLKKAKMILNWHGIK